MVRYHRKGTPSLADFARLAEAGDDQLLLRCAAALRLAEQFERVRDQAVKAAHIAVTDGSVDLTIEADGDVTIARWAAERTSDVLKRAFGKTLRVS
jgi:exopolyphosphatase / guanosine-5'-triphosphate,3'-diphosphate pyrophosphatase